MKQLKLFILLSVMAIFLTACDIIPTDVVDELSAELCESDPDHELCQVDAISDIEETVIADFVKQSIMKIDSGMCEDIISPTSPELLKECMSTDSTIIPDDFTVDLLETSGYTQQEDTYIFLTNEPQYEITIQVVEIEGTMYIESLMIKEFIAPDDKISDLEADQLMKSFFMDLINRDISTEDFCATYYDNNIDNDCDGLKGDVPDDITDIADLSVTRVSEYEFRGHVTVLKSHGGTETVEYEVTVFRQEFGPVQISRISFIEEVDIVSLGEEKLMMMLYDYFNPMYTDEQFFAMYQFTNGMDMRYKELMEFNDFSVYDLMENDMGVSALVRVRFKAGAELSKKVNIAFDEDSDGDMIPTFSFEMPLDNDPIVSQDILKEYFDMFFDEDMTDDEFFMKFNGAGMYHPILMKRSEFVGSMDETVMITLIEGNEYKIEINNIQSNYKTAFTLEVRVNRWESKAAIDINGIDDDCNLVCETVNDPIEHRQLFEMFISDFTNPDITDEMMNMKYFNGEENEIISTRQEALTEFNSLTILEQIGPMDGFFIYLVDTGNEMNRNGEPVKVKIKRIDKSSPLLMVFDDPNSGDIPTEEQFSNLIDSFVTMTNTQSIVMTEMCRSFTPESRVDSCAEMLSSKLSMGYNLTGLIRLQQRPDLLMAEWEDAVGMKIQEPFLFYIYNHEGMVYIELIPYIKTEADLLTEMFEPYIMALNDSTVPLDQTCMYVDEMSQDECTELKTYLLETSSTVMLYMIYPTDDMQYVVVLDIFDTQGNYLTSLEYDTMYRMDSPLYKDRGTRGVNPLFQ